MGCRELFAPWSWALTLCVAGTASITYACMTADWAWGAAGGVMWLLAAWRHHVVMRRQHEGLELMVEAVMNRDYAFRLPVRHRGRTAADLFNEAINRMGAFWVEEEKTFIAREHYYEVILRHVSTGVVVMDGRDGRILFCNDMALQLLNVSHLSMLGQLPADRQDVKECFQTLQPGENGTLTVGGRRGVRQLLARVVLLRQNDAQLRIFTLNDVRNVLDEHEMEAWVKLTRVLVHELINGMTPVCSLSSSMLEKPRLTPEQLRDGLSAIRATSRGLLSFVENYRRFTSMPKPCPDVFCVGELLGEVESLQMLPPHIRMAVRVNPPDVMLYADRDLIRQVVINLIRNAVQAIGEEEGRIDISVELAENEHVLVYVANDGPAIPRGDTDQLFVPFYTTKSGGSGIGLSVSRQIMVLSNGSITLLPSGTRGWNTVFLLDFA